MTNTKSYSASVKEVLTEAEYKKKCCKRLFADVCDHFSNESTFRESLEEILRLCKCQNCQKAFIAACFICRGSMTDPEKQNHLDFTFNTEEERDTVAAALTDIGFTAKTTVRKGKSVLYFKDNDSISDLLAFLGATKAAFDVMNTKIVKEVRNNANRLVNCDTANIEKAISASQKYVDAISFIKEHGGIETLPSELSEAAHLRESLPQASLSELASKCNPPITKSGMKHRLEKLLSAAEELRSRLK